MIPSIPATGNSVSSLDKHLDNAATVAIHQALNKAIESNNFATVQMRSQDYSEAREMLGNTLAQLKEEAQSFRSQKVTSMVNFGVHCHWDSVVHLDSCLESSEFPSMVHGPLILCPFETSKEGCEEDTSSSVECAIVLTSLSLVCNLGMCYQALGDRLLGEGNQQDAVDLLQKSVRLYECSRKLVVSLKQPAHPVELLLLSNLGHACLRLNQPEQANQWSQHLSIASTQFRRTNKLYQMDEGIRSLVDSLLPNFVAVAWAGYPIAAAAA